MKKIGLLTTLLVAGLLLTGCNNNDYYSDNRGSCIYEVEDCKACAINEFVYYTAIGLGNGFDEEIEEGKLVLKLQRENSEHYIIFDKGTWEDYVNGVNSGETVLFIGNRLAIDSKPGVFGINSISRLERCFIIN